MGLREHYNTEILPSLHKELGEDRSIMSMPRIVKITLNMGVGGAKDDKKLENAVKDLSEISARKPVVTLARISEAGFKIRAGWPIDAR